MHQGETYMLIRISSLGQFYLTPTPHHCCYMVYVPPTAKVIHRWDLCSKSCLKDWRSPGLHVLASYFNHYTMEISPTIDVTMKKKAKVFLNHPQICTFLFHCTSDGKRNLP